jgi:hypothetical protein
MKKELNFMVYDSFDFIKNMYHQIQLFGKIGLIL